MQPIRKRPKPNRCLVATTFVAGLASPLAHAGDWKLGIAIGFGGAGITKDVAVDEDGIPDPNGASPTGDNVGVSVSRNEGPGTFNIYLEKLIRDSLSFSIEHARGFRIGPYSSGVSFTGVATRWYFLGPAPSVSESPAGQSSVFIKRITPFLGAGLGIASGTVDRDSDLIAKLTGSGLYAGIKLGADYPLSPGFGIRPEIAGATSLMSPTVMQHFSVQLGFYFYPW